MGGRHERRKSGQNTEKLRQRKQTRGLDPRKTQVRNSPPPRKRSSKEGEQEAAALWGHAFERGVVPKSDEQARRLIDLHVKGDPLILFNIWDAGSAKAIEEIGAKAVATGSWSVAAAHGFDDGEKLPFDLVVANTQRIVESVTIPVTIDLEGGYGSHPSEVRDNVSRVIAAGAVGINLEDQIGDGEGLYSIEVQCTRIAAARAAADTVSMPFFINARTDVFLQSDPVHHGGAPMTDAERRAAAYADAGASGLFAPALRDEAGIERLCKSVRLPVNILVRPEMPSLKRMAALGVARISYGPGPYRLMIQALKEAGRRALTG